MENVFIVRNELIAIGMATIIALSMIVPFHALAQNDQAIDIVKTKKDEQFSFSYDVANRDRKDPAIYKYDTPKGQNWILSIDNKLQYLPRNDSKVVILLREPAPSEKYIEITMGGNDAKKFAVATNTELGLTVLYSKDSVGWSPEDLQKFTHVENSGLTVSDGKRIVVDRVDLQGFDIDSIEVYGKDETGMLENAYGGVISFGILYGDLSDELAYYVPFIVMAIIGAIIGIALYTKKRKED